MPVTQKKFIERNRLEVKQFISDLHSYAGIELSDSELEAYEADGPEPSEYVFKEGDQARVIHRINGHKFKIGTVVHVVSVCKTLNDFMCEDIKGTRWYLRSEELEPVQNTPQQ